MSVTWSFELGPRARKTLRKLDHPVATRILKELKTISSLDDPRQRGKALTGPYGGLWRYRVGDWRIICSIQDDALVILALDVGHRSRIYH